MSIYKTVALLSCFVTSVCFADASNYGAPSSKSEKGEEKLLDYKIELTILKNGMTSGPGAPGAPGAPNASGGAAPSYTNKGESAPDMTPGSNPASFDMKKQYRTALQKGHVGPFTKIYDNQTVMLSTFETYAGAAGEEKLIDYGVYVGLGRPLSPESDACNADKLDSRTTFFLFGKNGVLGVNFISKSLLGEAHSFDIMTNTGVYENWSATKTSKVAIDCMANENQWTFTGQVRLKPEVKK